MSTNTSDDTNIANTVTQKQSFVLQNNDIDLLDDTQEELKNIFTINQYKYDELKKQYDIISEENRELFNENIKLCMLIDVLKKKSHINIPQKEEIKPNCISNVSKKLVPKIIQNTPKITVAIKKFEKKL